MEATPASEGRGWTREAAAGTVLGAVLSFLGAVTLGNGPYPFLGYGLLSLPLFLLPFVLPRSVALVAFFAGTVLGVAVDLRSGSVFAFVAIGAVFLRGIQLVVILRLKEKHGFLLPVLLALLFGTIAALLVGVVSFGADGLQPAYSVLDVVFIVPAYLAIRVVHSSLPWAGKVFGTVAVLGGTLGVFFASSAFLLILPVIVASVLLAVGVLLVWRMGRLSEAFSRPGVMAAASLLAVVGLVVAFALSGPAAGAAARATLYPLYPDSIAGTQWLQISNAAGCRAGNLVGGGTQANGLWGAARLRLLSTCVTARGIVVAIQPSSGPAVDGDYSFDLQLDPGYADLLALGSGVFLSGYLHVEVVPSDQPTVLGNVTLVPGAHVQVRGAWVLDTDHGWFSEIHPAWSVVVLAT